MRIAVIGAGNIGRALIRDVLEAEKDAQFLAADFDERALAEAARLDPSRVKTRKAQAEHSGEIAELVRGADVAVNCTYGAKCMEILDAAIAARVAYVDVHGTLLLEERFSRSEAAKAAGITALIGMGVSPGLTDMLAAYGARKFKGAVSIECEYATHRPINPTEGLLETALRQFRNGVMAPIFEDGRTSFVPPFSGAIRTRFPGIDEEVELVYTPHSEPLTVPRFVKNAKRVSVRGAYHPKIMALLRSLYEFGLLEPKRRVTVAGAQVDFQPLLREALNGDGSPKPAGLQTTYVMRVRVSGDSGKFEATMGHPPGWDALPQGRMTALPTAFAARLVAKREFRYAGVCGPELFTDAQVEACVAHLQSRGLWMHQTSG